MSWKSQTTFRIFYKGKTDAERLGLIWIKIDFQPKNPFIYNYVTLENSLFNQMYNVLGFHTCMCVYRRVLDGRRGIKSKMTIAERCFCK